MTQISVGEISRRLAEQAERVCGHLLPGGKLFKGEWVCGDIAGGPGDSLKVHLSGHHAGCWKDWANPDDHGDLLDLWRLSRNLSPGEAVRQAKAWLGIADTAFQAKAKSWKRPPSKPHAAPDPAGRAFRWLTETRKLSAETIDRFKVSIDSGGQAPAVVFPCFSPEGELVNRSYRTLPPPSEKKKVWQDAGCAPCLFGWQALPESALRNRTVLLSEGQIDAMTWHQWGIPALSIPAGSGQTWIEFEWENLAAFDHIFIAFDSDEAGQENARKAIARLGVHRCLLVRLPGHKDANEALQAGCAAEDAARWVAEAKPPAVSGLVRASDLAERLAAEVTPKPEAFTLPFFRLQWPFTGLYFRPGEVTVWTGASHHGKSTFLNYLTLCAVSRNLPVFIASMEVKPETTLRKMAASALAVKGHELSPDAARSFLMEFGESLIFADVVGFIPQERLLEMMRFSFQRYGAGHFIIDSLMRVAGLEEDFPAQGEFMNRLQEFAKQSGAHVHLVAHPRKLAANGKPAAMDIKGSSLIPNNADNIVAVVRNVEKAEIMRERELTPAEAADYDTEIRVEKQRESGWTGGFLLRFDPRSYAYSLLSRPAGGNVGARQESRPAA